ncbi:VTT domain-containing protein [Halorubrum sp. CBA1229]|uniref:VTT domain-containing protein n=1 Tax=Halorubrum sp. CBA1229 TaxID=1853699 RepID=UPI000F3BDACF|nr:VTT domain-containing protein [Halorubrum sp. CBA1229]QKY17919.1 VTT domain-containing protein [Halorubrum sp. CBA1229]
MNRRFVLLGYVAAGVAVTVAAAVAWLASPEAVLGRLSLLADNPIRYGVALLALTAVRPLLAWPTTLLAVAVGFGYGWAGVPLGVALLVATAILPYRLARAGRVRARGAFRVADRLCDAGERLATAAGGVRAVAATRLLPIPSDAVSVGAGAVGIRRRPFLLGTAAGELPWVVVGVAVGVSLDRLAAGDLSVVDPTVLVAMAGVGALLLAGPLYRTFVGEGPASTA